MSKADTMFYQLGYTEKINSKQTCEYRTLGFDLVAFNYKDKKIFYPNGYLDLEMLKAINEKTKELGWLDE